MRNAVFVVRVHRRDYTVALRRTLMISFEKVNKNNVRSPQARGPRGIRLPPPIPHISTPKRSAEVLSVLPVHLDEHQLLPTLPNSWIDISAGFSWQPNAAGRDGGGMGLPGCRVNRQIRPECLIPLPLSTSSHPPVLFSSMYLKKRVAFNFDNALFAR